MGRFVQVAAPRPVALQGYARLFGGTAKLSNKRPPAYQRWDTGAATWDVTLRFDGRRMTTPFHVGPKWKSKPPDPCDVLESLLSDASSYENESYGGWTQELGYDPDAAVTRRVYKAVARQTEKLRRFLGDSYEDVLYHEDLRSWCVGQRHVP